MKKTLAKTLRSALALVLALTMVLGTVGTTFAAEPSVDVDSAVAKLVDVLEQYGPDVVEEARQYAEKHGYVEAVKETASALKAALIECANEHEYLVSELSDLLAGPKAQLAALKKEAQNLIVLIAIYKAGGFSGSNGTSTAAVITVPGFGTVDTDKIDIENFDIEDLTPEQKDAIDKSGLLGDVKVDDLTDAQVEALKEAGLKGEIPTEGLTEEQVEQIQQIQNNLNKTVDTIEKTQNTVNALEDKLAALKAEIVRLKEAAQATEDLAGTIISILKQETVKGAELAAEKYVAARNALFAKLAEIEKPYTYMDDLVIDIAKLSVTVATEIKDLTAFVASDLKNTVANNKLIIAGAFVLAAEKLGVSQETLEKVAAKVQEKLPVAAHKVCTLISDLKAKAYKAYKEATTDDYCVDYDSYYVAIGDDTAADDNSYVDLLYKELDLPKGAYSKVMTDANLIQDTVLNAEEIAKADIITIGYSTANFIGNVAGAIMGKEVNWSAYLPEEAVKALNVAMDEVEAYVEAFGFGANTAKALTAAIENVAFNSLVYAYKLPKTIAAIREINEDAVLVVVGLDNPLEGATISHNSRTVGIDKLTDAIVAVTDVYTLCYAILASNCTFVAAPNAANDAEGTDITVENLVATMMDDGLLPNAQGQKYIQTRIYESLRITHGYLWGDANLDGVVDYKDAMIILQHSVNVPVHGGFIYTPVCDVDGVAGINYKDSMRVLQKSVNLIDKFEVEQ